MFKMIKRMSFVIGIILVLILSFSYGTFIYTSDSYRTTEMLVSNLTYGIDITSSDATISGKTVSVSSGKTAVVYLKVTSLNKVDTKYGVDYKITKGTGTVKYASNTGWLPTGKISENNVGTYEKVVKVVISAETDMSVDFTVTGGFTNNELTEVETGYTRITEKADNVISYNDTLTNVVKKETTNNIYGGESTNNYAQYPINEDNTKNIWRILGTYNGIGTKIVSNQVSTTTKSTLSTDLTSFYNTLEKPDNYILSTDKFACTNTSCTSSSYSKVGLISTSEYEMLGGINSYLASSESYFALDNGTIKNITSGGIEETSTTSGLRPAVYLQDYVTVTGSGTVSDPFKLKMPEYAVVLNVVNGSATLPSKMITMGENATYEITPNTGYKLVLSSNTCSNGTLEGNVFTITNVTSAQSCTITLTPESYTLTLDPNGGSVSTTSKTVTYDSTYGELPTPTRTGYTFNGWKGKNLYSDLYNIEFGELSYSNGIFKQTSDDGTTHSFELQGFKDLAYVKNVSSSNYDISIGKKTFSFTADGTYNGLRLKINGGKQDNYVLFNTPFLENGKTYTLSFQVINSTAGSISWNNLQIEEGSKATVYEPIYVTSSTKVTLTTNHKLVADWTANTYSVTLNVTNGTGSSTKTVAYGNSATFTVSPNSGYKLELETNTCGGTLSGNTYTISNVTFNKSCSIGFKKKMPTLAETIKSYSTSHTNGVYNENGYRYEGTDPSNYIYMTNKSTNEKELWRIIGVFNDGENGEEVIRVRRHYEKNNYPTSAYDASGSTAYNYKNIKESKKSLLAFNDDSSEKYIAVGDFVLCPNCKNHWPISSLYTKLKEIYSTTYYKYTVDFTIYLGGSSLYDIPYIPQELYDMERMLNGKGTAGATSKASYSSITTFIGSVGLMYPSDYAYAAIASDCERTLTNLEYDNISACHNNNWLFQGQNQDQWLISPSVYHTYSGVLIMKTGLFYDSGAGGGSTEVAGTSAYSPVMALKSDVYVTGSGTQSDPYVMQ